MWKNLSALLLSLCVCLSLLPGQVRAADEPEPPVPPVIVEPVEPEDPEEPPVMPMALPDESEEDHTA